MKCQTNGDRKSALGDFISTDWVFKSGAPGTKNGAGGGKNTYKLSSLDPLVYDKDDKVSQEYRSSYIHIHGSSFAFIPDSAS